MTNFGAPGPAPQLPERLATLPNVSTVAAEGAAILICSTELRTARASEEALALLGIHQSYIESNQISLFDLILADDVGAMQSLLQSLIEPVKIPLLPAPRRKFLLSTSPAALIEPASGTIFPEVVVQLRFSDRQFHPCRVRIYVGGGLGADLYRPDTYHSAYIVVSIKQMQVSSNRP